MSNNNNKVPIEAIEFLTLLSNAKSTSPNDERWYKSIIIFDANIRSGSNNCLWQTIFVMYNGEKRRLKLKISNEKIFGHINPNTQAEVDRINGFHKGKSHVSIRNMGVSLKIAKTRQRVGVEKDGFTISNDFIYNDDDLSAYYKCIEFISEIFETEIKYLKNIEMENIK